MTPLRSPVDIYCFCCSRACLMDFTAALENAQEKYKGLKDKRRKDGVSLKREISRLEVEMRQSKSTVNLIISLD